MEGAGNQGLCLLSKLENNECIDYHVWSTLDYCISGAEGEVNHTPQQAGTSSSQSQERLTISPFLSSLCPFSPLSSTYSTAFNMVFLHILIVVKYNIKLTILTIFKWTALWHQVDSCHCTIITTIHLQNVFIFPRETPCPLNTNSPFLPP